MNLLKITCFFVLLFIQFSCAAHSEDDCLTSLFSYTGYLTTPSAYIKDGHLGFNYSYFPKDVAPYHKKGSDNKIYSLAMGFLPFIECYLSLFVTPQIEDTIVKDTHHNTRSAGIKMRIIKERKWIPSTAIGIFDPDLKQLGLKQSANNISSTFIVFSKRLNYSDSSVSVGYGFEELTGEYTHLRGFFCGGSVNLRKNFSILVDYDSELWSSGINTKWRGVNIGIALIEGNHIAYRAGYNFNLHNR